MSWEVAFGLGAILVFSTLVWALCRAASEGDRAIQEREVGKLVSLNAQRAKRDARNGLGKASGRRVS